MPHHICNILLKTKIAADSSDGDLISHMFGLKDAAVLLATRDPRGILTIKK